ncbi:MAG TPA: YceI family protein [Gemmatimonadaceae bacterium]|jgi:polyisoprenoid-binding protein YceI|nr:YceI family protein [Gemmatimonadaceae bacterium]
MATTQAPVKTSTWKIDPSHSLIEFGVKHLMISTVKGRFADVEGDILIAAGDPAHSSVTASIKALSIDTRTGQRDEHLRSADFLDAATFPEITFKSTRIDGDADEFKVHGDLTIRGVTRQIVLDVTNEGSAKDPWGGDRIGFSGKTKFDRRDFGLTWNQAIESGGVVVGHEVKVSLEIQAVKQA